MKFLIHHFIVITTSYSMHADFIRFLKNFGDF